MGIIFTVVYIVLTIISPEQFGTAWANSHALVYLAVVTALFSLPNVLSRSYLASSLQTYLLLGFIVAIGLSQIAHHWLGGALQAWLAFLPSAAVYFFIVANVTTVRRLKIVALASVVACLGLVAEAFCGYYGGFLGDTFVLKMRFESGQAVEQILRLRGVGVLNDPNDFAQILIIALALLFIAWRQGRVVANSVFVLVPAVVLLWAIYLTHSRGALIGLAVLALMAGYRRIGKVPALVLAGMLGIGLMALDFTGGRAISADAGVDRLSLWASGLELFKSAPIFGVGFGNFADLAGQTAHNSFILPLAELGIIGATLWVALLVTATMDLNRLIAVREEPGTAGEGSREISESPDGENGRETASHLSFDSYRESAHDQAPDYGLGHHSLDALPDRRLVELARLEDEPSVENQRYESLDAPPEILPLSDESFTTREAVPTAEVEPEVETVPAARAPVEVESVAPNNPLIPMRLALVSFMATGWFLSRTYETPIYLVLGLAVAGVGLNPHSGGPRDRRWISVTLAVEAFLIIFVYLVVRLRH